MVAAQNRRIDQLVEKIKQQQDKMEKQSLHLQTLQSKVSDTTAPLTLQLQEDPSNQNKITFLFRDESHFRLLTALL